jgi:hypothetical protein
MAADDRRKAKNDFMLGIASLHSRPFAVIRGHSRSMS